MLFFHKNLRYFACSLALVAQASFAAPNADFVTSPNMTVGKINPNMISDHSAMRAFNDLIVRMNEQKPERTTEFLASTFSLSKDEGNRLITMSKADLKRRNVRDQNSRKVFCSDPALRLSQGYSSEEKLAELRNADNTNNKKYVQNFHSTLRKEIGGRGHDNIIWWIEENIKPGLVHINTDDEDLFQSMGPDLDEVLDKMCQEIQRLHP